MIISELIRTKKGKIITTQRVFITCDQCNKNYDLRYKSAMENRNTYDKDLCQSCRLKLQYQNGARTSHFKIYNQSESNKGTFDERYGKEKSDKIKKEMSDKRKGKNNPNYNGKYSKMEECVQLSKMWKGKTLEDRFGFEKSKNIKHKISLKISGKNNGMYGKSSPIGSGNGWSGWYKNIYFRSILELSYIKYLYDNKIIFKCGEKLKIPYMIEDTLRNYLPDFIIGNKIIEVKPKLLINTIQNKLKFEAAKNIYGNNFIVLTEDDIIQLKFEEIDELLKIGDLMFIERYQLKFNVIKEEIYK